jgi:hypothetical protein
MESETFSLDEAKRSLLEEGFADMYDPEVGEHVWAFERREFPFCTEVGMDFLMQQILCNPVRRGEMNYSGVFFLTYF